MGAVSVKPFGDALRILMSERELTYRSLAEATRSLDGKGMPHAHLNMLANGHDKPSTRAMELIARACDVKPEHFAEYRLAVAMRELDPAEVGLERALANLSARLGDHRRSDARERPAQRPQARPSQWLAIGSTGLSARANSKNQDNQAICTPRCVTSG